MIGMYIAQGLKRDAVLTITGVSKHQYYYRSKSNKKRGCPVSIYTIKDDVKVSNATVVDKIKVIQSDPDTNYGYQRMTYALMLLGYYINHKKVYRLMKESSLLHERNRNKSSKQYAKYRIVAPTRPLELLEMDIKMVWLNQYRRHAYILTIIDTFTRVVLDWSVGYQMKQDQVNQALQQVIINHLQPANLLQEELHVELRNDNGPQFCAHNVRDFLDQNHIGQVFTHPYTPQENGHVESFHAILKEALGNHQYWSLNELEIRLTEFYHNYNEKRIHSSIAFLAPMMFWKCWEKKLITRIEMGKRKSKFKLKIPYQKLSGIESLKEVPCLNSESLNGMKNLFNQDEVIGPNALVLQPSV